MCFAPATTACTFSTSQLPKVVRTRRVLTLFTSKCAWHHNGVHFFRHLNFQKWSEPEVCLTFSLPKVLRATTACTFSTSQLPKVVRTCDNFNSLTQNVLRTTTACNFSFLICLDVSAPAALASLFFDPPREPQSIGKTEFFATSLLFRAPASSLF